MRGKDTRLSGLLPLSNIVTGKKQNRRKTKSACEAWQLDLSSLDWGGESSFVFLFITGTKLVIQHDPFWTLDPSVGGQQSSEVAVTSIRIVRNHAPTKFQQVPVTLNTVSVAWTHSYQV